MNSLSMHNVRLSLKGQAAQLAGQTKNKAAVAASVHLFEAAKSLNSAMRCMEKAQRVEALREAAKLNSRTLADLVEGSEPDLVASED